MTKKSKKSEEKVIPEPTPAEIEKVFAALNDDPVLEVDGIEITEVPPEEPQEPQPLVLTKDELHSLLLTQFQIRAYEAEQKLETIRRDLFLRQIDPEGRLNQMNSAIRGRNEEAATARTEYAKTVQSIEDRLKIKLKEYGYDDLTGQLSPVG